MENDAIMGEATATCVIGGQAEVSCDGSRVAGTGEEGRSGNGGADAGATVVDAAVVRAEGVGGRRVLQVQRTRSGERIGRSATRGELEEFRAACKLDTEKMLAGHTRDVENLIEAQMERVTKIVEPLKEAVAETNERVARLEAGKDEATL